MIENFIATISDFYKANVVGYIQTLYQYPIKLITLIIDLIIVIFLGYKLIQILKDTRAWQLLKGIMFLLIATTLSEVLNLNILNYILTSFISYGVIILIVVFQPELRRALEQLGTSKMTKFFGFDKDLATRTKESIYRAVIASTELSQNRVGGLIVFERDIKIKDILNTGIPLDAEITPQLLVNIFSPNTPLHDGAIIISNNKIAAAACMLPLASDRDISKELGTRHRAGVGISKESDAIAIIISEETGKISVAKDGTLIADVKEETLKKILIKNVVTKQFAKERDNLLERIKERVSKKKE